MRIGIISTLARPVPPKAEGSVELLVSYLTDFLVERGHEVTLFALPESNTRARLLSPVESSYVRDPDKWDWQLYESFQVKEAFGRWREFDVINCHSYYFGLMYADAVPIPSVQSFHIDPGPDYRFLAQRTQNRQLHFCSQYQARGFNGMSGIHVIPHGIDVDAYARVPIPTKHEYLAWLGRFHPEKGVLAAIDIARKASLPLKLAAPANDYYRDVIAPHVDGGAVEYVGELAESAKAAFLANAMALLYPVERGEPFGLVLIEAMAAGLPVVAYDKGAVPEIIESGVTGFLGSREPDLLEGIARARHLDRSRIRAEAKQKFSFQAMGARMENLMMEITGSHAG